ncbi:MAG: cytochrome c [Candidatus Binatia bacterium]|nr:MAG: cytochrome c [Candidatus Binatia bacterium]
MSERPNLWRNPVSMAGWVIAGLAAVCFVFLWLYDTLAPGPGAPYAGIVIFIVTPAFLLFGLTLVPVGWWWSRRHWRRTGAAWALVWPVIDFNQPQTRKTALLVASGGLLFSFLSVFGAFQAYEATESVTFCGALCHRVMGPEYAAYQVSPHARVACVDCHVGSGAEWYLRSKFSGVRQLYHYVTGTYSRPIPVPVHNLRPATDTCQACHWPEKPYGRVGRRYVYFLADESNTRWETDMEILVGGGRPGTPQAGGIHWHMQIENVVEYVAADEARSSIWWVRATNRSTGASVLYRSPEVEGDPPADARWRTMDCMDCHNRPAHVFRAPRDAVNEALAAGVLDPRLPSVKEAAIDLLTEDYEDTPSALAALRAGLAAFYREKFPEIAEREGAAIGRAVAELERIYRENFFPEMKVRWDAYPSHDSHLFSPGCFRCHDGRHAAADGSVIRNDCNLCHIVRAQGPPDNKQYATAENGLEFEHPADVGSDWKESPCYECHSGAAP